ncbi:Gp49 family protein [Acinetobacter sp. CFCC 10889]|uniref:Gp49 family protein n=1 Tax=Acinetobacter sp. CFCC 10889 TaxID=1775557 RepID=UPI000DCF944B|nr:Gp49 family protein [Acinetobacter sp. CFCC 10889]
MSNEKQIESEIQAKGLNAPRLTPVHIDRVIVGETYTNLPDGRTVICQLTLKNGFTVDGKSACVSKDNFNQEIGNQIARENAREKIWELEGYLLKEKLYQTELDKQF